MDQAIKIISLIIATVIAAIGYSSLRINIKERRIQRQQQKKNSQHLYYKSIVTDPIIKITEKNSSYINNIINKKGNNIDHNLAGRELEEYIYSDIQSICVNKVLEYRSAIIRCIDYWHHGDDLRHEIFNICMSIEDLIANSYDDIKNGKIELVLRFINAEFGKILKT